MRYHIKIFALLFFCESALAQPAAVFCQFNEAESAVMCIDPNARRPIFEYKIFKFDMDTWRGIVLASTKEKWTNSRGESCRTKAETTRASILEANFRNSLELFRTEAEKFRQESTANLALYQQLILIYRGLIDQYSGSLKAYRATIDTCRRNTPFDVIPDRFSSKSTKGKML